jgi:hypothetical protein
MRKKRIRKDEKREVTPEFVNMSKEILYPQIQGVTDEDFGREIFKVEDPVVKDSAGALFDRMWGAYGREAVRERSDRARDQVSIVCCFM